MASVFVARPDPQLGRTAAVVIAAGGIFLNFIIGSVIDAVPVIVGTTTAFGPTTITTTRGDGVGGDTATMLNLGRRRVGAWGGSTEFESSQLLP
jgi:hypothetical protein